jgi:hypothetical protein
VEEETLAPFAAMVRHLHLLKRALEREGISAVEESRGGSYVALRVAGVPGPVTCRSNPADEHHPWYWCDNEPLVPAGGINEAREAATKLKQMRALQAAP